MRLMLLCLATIILAGCDKPVREAHFPVGIAPASSVCLIGQ
jgi:hypothetical protein